MGVIVPAILPKSRDDLDEKLLRLHGLVDAVQVDIVDGRFVVPATWPYQDQVVGVREPSGDTFPYLGEISYEVDLMVEEPEQVIRHWIEAGATRIVIHAETTRMLPKLMNELASTYGHDKDFTPGLLAFGLAINISTDTALIEPFLHQCDFVQFMGIAKIGKQGEPFDKSVLPKISAFRKKYPDMQLQVDGGVSLETAPQLLQAGVSRLVVGSDLWKAPDLAAELKRLQGLVHTYGLYA
ncbi:MAG: ribulose-phosphate 3-epimerase [Parcubacteria bacterium C7867-008]|nr:MAG: ribulose-phosphate 3-epimerase [Parcubacteria bacterium C7867-008]